MSMLTTGEYHRFEAAGRPYLYLVQSAAVFGIDQISQWTCFEIAIKTLDVGAGRQSGTKMKRRD